MLKIYIADTSPLEKEDKYLEYYDAVSDKRKNKTDKMKVMQGRILSVGVETLLIKALGEEGLDYYSIETAEGKYGKPFFVNNPDFHFSLSHSFSRVMCAVSDKPVGCDTEHESGSNLKIAERFFSEKEYDYLCSLETEKKKRETFGRFWTLKESFMKVTGLGFSLPLKDFSVDISSDIVKVEQSVSDHDFYFFELFQKDGYSYACCSESSDKPEIFFVTL